MTPTIRSIAATLPPVRPFAGRLAVALVYVLSSLPALSWADNPIVQTVYTADPAPLVHEGTLYLYTSHDEDVTVNDFFTMHEWRVYSTKDVVNWTDHGSPLHYRDFAWARGDAWAGQVIHRNGKFYFYVPVVQHSGASAIGVAVSDSPLGPFTDAVGAPLVTSNCGDIDPTVFIDGDNQAYLYWGNPRLCYVRLNADMISYQGGVTEVEMNTGSFGVRAMNDRPTSYEEGPWFYKRGALYYLIFPGGPLPEHIAYSTSTSPTGPWTYRSVIMPAEGSSFTNHPGIVDFGGKSLFFYHNGALPGGGGFKRSVCVEEFTYGADGSIPQLRMTSEGASAVASLDPFVQVEAETIAWSSGVETEPCNEGGMNITALDAGDFIKVKEVDFRGGAKSFDARVAAPAGGGAIELRLDGVDGRLVATCPVAATGGAQMWATQSCSVEGVQGKHDLFLRFTGGGFKLNWWRFTPGDESGGEDTGTNTSDSAPSTHASNTESTNVAPPGTTVSPTPSTTTIPSATPGTSTTESTSNTQTSTTTGAPSGSPTNSSTVPVVTPTPSGETSTAHAPTTSGTGTSNGASGCACRLGADERAPTPLVGLGFLSVAMLLGKRRRSSVRSVSQHRAKAGD